MSQKHTEADAIRLFKAGRMVLVVEYRGSSVDHITWTDKQTRVRKEADLCKHTVEVGSRSMMVNERMAEDWDGRAAAGRFEAGQFPFPKGTRCVLEYKWVSQERGVLEAEGVLVPLDMGPAKV